MIDWLVAALHTLNNPSGAIPIGFAFVCSYYMVSAFFHNHDPKPTYKGVWRKGGFGDIATSMLWCSGALFLMASLVDLLVRNELSLGQLVSYYCLFLFLFAFIYNMLNRHFPGMIEGLKNGWIVELQCFSMSVQVMTTGDLTSAKPAKPAEFIASLQLLLGLLFVAVFVAKTVGLMAVGSGGAHP